MSDFEALQGALRSQAPRLIFYVFDLLHLDGKDLREKPLLERRAKLRKLVGRDSDSRIQFSEGDARWVQPALTLRVKNLANARMLWHATVKGLVQ